MMRIGIDFDNTIICYDEVFCHLAKLQHYVAPDFSGSKRELKAVIQASAEGDVAWQKLQGKAYGEFLSLARAFDGVKEFLEACRQRDNVEVFVVSHKTEFGHFDEKRINLRDAAKDWLRAQGFHQGAKPAIAETNLFFETTREAKIARIKALNCTHFIDDLPEVLHAPIFPANVTGLLFQPDSTDTNVYTNWKDIKHAIFN